MNDKTLKHSGIPTKIKKIYRTSAVLDHVEKEMLCSLAKANNVSKCAVIRYAISQLFLRETDDYVAKN